ncbi:MAG: HNH endonuclease [Rhodoblastus sp.]|nr:HNH endonuclease [Rhodoblastus sp.]MCB9999826.1 HNH endonuclease [Methylobacteriaceae bacterium]MCC0001529.1 HNH endonuclease [Methylobacteriaceae bacterium]
MPVRAPYICGCGKIVPSGQRCECSKARDRERKARHDQVRPSARERGYTGKWEKERATYLAAHPRCVYCGEPASIVDHIVPHRGDRSLFWRRSNWQALCAPCHNGGKQSQERQQRR